MSGDQRRLAPDAPTALIGATRQAALEAEGLIKRYRGGVMALAGITVAVREHSITALVGPNGAGKSTLIRSWLAFERPTRGRVRVAGIDPWRDRRGAVARIGYVPQQPALYRALTVLEHLEWSVQVRPGFDIRAARSYLDHLGIPPRAKPTSLSGGQLAQVTLAIALGTRAPILLMDEPLASLDPLARSEFLALVHSTVRELGTTALLSSHIVSDLAQACDHIIVLGVGRVLLNEAISQALAMHSIQSGSPPEGYVMVGSFADGTGDVVTLLRNPVDATQRTSTSGITSQASLEQIVKGYLAASREEKSWPAR